MGESQQAFLIAKGKKEFLTILERSGIESIIGKDNIFTSLSEGAEYFKKQNYLIDSV